MFNGSRLFLYDSHRDHSTNSLGYAQYEAHVGGNIGSVSEGALGDVHDIGIWRFVKQIGYERMLSSLALCRSTNIASKADTMLEARISGHDFTSGTVYDLEARRYPKRQSDGSKYNVCVLVWRVARRKRIRYTFVLNCRDKREEYKYSGWGGCCSWRGSGACQNNGVHGCEINVLERARLNEWGRFRWWGTRIRVGQV